MKRTVAIDQIRSGSDPFDIIVVGGGATGLGTAVDAASRGHRTLLIEQSDFAKGTSSRSTKLVHGGVRYLQQGNVSLVLEALRERGLLYRNAPHLVLNMAFVIPNYKWWEGPFYGIGMKVYDGLAGRLGLSPSRWLSREETLERIPTVETEGLTGAVVYHDGQFDDARLAINLAQTAVECGATVANYMRCVGLIKEKGITSGILAKDSRSTTQRAGSHRNRSTGGENHGIGIKNRFILDRRAGFSVPQTGSALRLPRTRERGKVISQRIAASILDSRAF